MYFPDVIVRHNHPVIGLQEWDRQYRLLNSEQYYRRGEEEFQAFLKSNLATQIINKTKLSMKENNFKNS
jgi:hypothetical protein